MKFTHTVTTLLLTSAILACGDSTGPKNNAGTFTGTMKVTGQADRAINGTAFHGFGEVATADTGFAIGLGTGEDETTTIVFYRGKNSLPAAQTYQLFDLESEADPTENDFVSIVMTQPGNDSTAALCLATGGSVTVSSATNDRVKGTFSMIATCTKLIGGAEYEATFQGSFNSNEGEVEVPGQDE